MTRKMRPTELQLLVLDDSYRLPPSPLDDARWLPIS